MANRWEYYGGPPSAFGFSLAEYAIVGLTVPELGQAIGLGIIMAGGAAWAARGTISSAYRESNFAKLKAAQNVISKNTLEIEEIKGKMLQAQAESQAIKNENTSLRMQLIERDKIIVERDKAITEQLASVHRRDQTIEEQMRLYRRQAEANSAMAEYIMIQSGNMRPSDPKKE